MLEDEMKRDASKYDHWFEQFNQFLKEGLMMDQENKDVKKIVEAMIPLLKDIQATHTNEII